MKYFVYHGYVTSDNYDCSEGSGPYRLDICDTEKEVMALRKEHEECLGKESSHPIFRVFQGEELMLEPKQTVTTWKFKRIL